MDTIRPGSQSKTFIRKIKIFALTRLGKGFIIVIIFGIQKTRMVSRVGLNVCELKFIT